VQVTFNSSTGATIGTVNQWIDCYFNHHCNRKRRSYANTATISAAEVTTREQQCSVTPVPVPQANVESPKQSQQRYP
jgi:hypothetical protein